MYFPLDDFLTSSTTVIGLLNGIATSAGHVDFSRNLGIYTLYSR